MPYILYINLKNLNWATQNVLPDGLAIAQKPHAIFITGISDFAQITWLQDWVNAGCEVTVELTGDVVGELPDWVNRVSLPQKFFTTETQRTQRRTQSDLNKVITTKELISGIKDSYKKTLCALCLCGKKIIINADYTIDNRFAWPTHQAALQKLLSHVQHLSVYGLQRHDIKQQLVAWLAKQGWGFYDAFHAKPLAAAPCQFLVDSYNLQMPLLGVGAGAYSRWVQNGVWFERKLNSQGRGVWQKLTTK